MKRHYHSIYGFEPVPTKERKILLLNISIEKEFRDRKRLEHYSEKQISRMIENLQHLKEAKEERDNAHRQVFEAFPYRYNSDDAEAGASAEYQKKG